MNRKRVQSSVEKLSDWLKAEATARETFNVRLVEKYNKMELDLIKIREESTKNPSENIHPIREECKKSHSDNEIKVNIPDTKEFCQKITLAEKQELSIEQNNVVNDYPAVKGQDTMSLNNQNYVTLSTSVRKEQYEDPELGVNHHSTNSVNGEGTNKGNISSKVIKGKIETETSLTELTLKKYFEYCQLISAKFFNIIFKMMSSNLMWGLMFTLLFHISAANATPSNNAGELSTISNGNLGTVHAPGSPSPNTVSYTHLTLPTILLV